MATDSFSEIVQSGAPTVHQIFDLCAPIAIMHLADLCYEDKAAECIVELHSRSLVYQNVRAYFQKNPAGPLSLEEWRAYISYAEPDGLHHINDVYKELFTEIVADLRPDWKIAVDRYGALGFRDEDGCVVFFGDGYNQLPWYETAELLVKRIQEYEEQVEREERE